MPPITYGPQTASQGIVVDDRLGGVNLNTTGDFFTVNCTGKTFASVQWVQKTGTNATAVVEAKPHIERNIPSSFGTPVTLGAGKITTDIDVRDVDYLTLSRTTEEGGTSTADFYVRLTDDVRS